MPVPGNSFEGVATTEISICSYPYIPLLHFPNLSISHPFSSSSIPTLCHILLGIFLSHPQYPLHSSKSPCHLISSHHLSFNFLSFSQVTRPPEGAAFDHHHSTVNFFTINRHIRPSIHTFIAFTIHPIQTTNTSHITHLICLDPRSLTFIPCPDLTHIH